MHPLISRLHQRASRLPPVVIRRDRQTAVLLVELTRLGDVLSAIPAVVTIRRWFTNASVTFLVRAQYVPFLRDVVPDIEICGIPDSRRSGGLLTLAPVLRRTRWGLACSLGPGRTNGLAVLLSNSASKAGYLECSSSVTPFRRNNPIFCYGTSRKPESAFALESISDRSLKVCSALGIDTLVNPFPLSVSASGASAAQSTLILRGIQTGEEYLVIHPFSRWHYRSWPAARYVELIQMILRSFAGRIVVIGEAAEQKQLDEFRHRFEGNKRIATVASSDLIESAEVIRHARLMIGNDSGPLHLAAALGTPAIGLFGPAEPALTAPVPVSPDRLMAVYHRLHCSPCDQRRCILPHDSCMQRISANEVMNSLLLMLERFTSRTSGRNA